MATIPSIEQLQSVTPFTPGAMVEERYTQDSVGRRTAPQVASVEAPSIAEKTRRSLNINNAQAAGVISGVGDVAGSFANVIEDLQDGKSSVAGGALQTAGKMGAMGMAFGPIGGAIGAGVGAVVGGVGAKIKNNRIDDQLEETRIREQAEKSMESYRPMINTQTPIYEEGTPGTDLGHLAEVERDELVMRKDAQGKFRLIADYRGGKPHSRGGELITLQPDDNSGNNEEGDIVFPKEKRKEVMSMLDSADHAGIESVRLGLPQDNGQDVLRNGKQGTKDLDLFMRNPVQSIGLPGDGADNLLNLEIDGGIAPTTSPMQSSMGDSSYVNEDGIIVPTAPEIQYSRPRAGRKSGDPVAQLPNNPIDKFVPGYDEKVRPQDAPEVVLDNDELLGKVNAWDKKEQDELALINPEVGADETEDYDATLAEAGNVAKTLAPSGDKEVVLEGEDSYMEEQHLDLLAENAATSKRIDNSIDSFNKLTAPDIPRGDDWGAALNYVPAAVSLIDSFQAPEQVKRKFVNPKQVQYKDMSEATRDEARRMGRVERLAADRSSGGSSQNARARKELSSGQEIDRLKGVNAMEAQRADQVNTQNADRITAAEQINAQLFNQYEEIDAQNRAAVDINKSLAMKLGYDATVMNQRDKQVKAQQEIMKKAIGSRSYSIDDNGNIIMNAGVNPAEMETSAFSKTTSPDTPSSVATAGDDSGYSLEGSDLTKGLFNGDVAITPQNVYEHIDNPDFLALPQVSQAAILGNASHESGDFGKIQEVGKTGGEGGLGLIQWTGSRRKDFESWLTDNGKSANDMSANVEYLMHEMQNGGADGKSHWTNGSYEEFLSITDVDEATKYFMDNYERPKEATAALDKRKKSANTYIS